MLIRLLCVVLRLPTMSLLKFVHLSFMSLTFSMAYGMLFLLPYFRNLFVLSSSWDQILLIMCKAELAVLALESWLMWECFCAHYALSEDSLVLGETKSP